MTKEQVENRLRALELELIDAKIALDATVAYSYPEDEVQYTRDRIRRARNEMAELRQLRATLDGANGA